MAGFDNDCVYGTNIDLSNSLAGTGGNPTLISDGQLLIASTALNAGGTHVNVGVLNSPLGTLSIGYSSPNITLDITGGSTAIEKINLQSGVSPIVPTGGLITFNGSVVLSGTNPVRTDGTGASVMALEVQLSQAIAAGDINKVGLSNFDSTRFTVSASGFVSVNGSGIGETITGNSGGALSPTAGNWNILGASTAAGTSPVSTSGAGSTLTINIQKSQAIAATDATKIGLSNFNSGNFSVDANGFVSIISGGFTWVDVTGATQTLAAQTGYVTDHVNVTYTLPASGTLGDEIRIVGKLGITTIAQNANQQIIMSSADSTVGATGSIVGTDEADCVNLICTTAGASTVWTACNFVGNWTVN